GEAQRGDEALALYREAAAHCAEAPLIHFNRGVALQDQGRLAEALQAYASCLSLDPRLADAHYNIAVILERRADPQGALRHFNAYRRLQRGADGFRPA
ncbi:MAG: tetratricopeptide repeat protein, partial [Burkholderiaceae bacterium]